jgi:hypothetical protein
MAAPSGENPAFGIAVAHTIADDWGHTRAFFSHQIESVALINVQRDLEGQIEQQVMQARAQAAAQRKVDADPSRKFLGPGGILGMPQ